jgi:hypothetical protein
MQFTVIDNFLSKETSDKLYNLIISKKIISLDQLPVNVNRYKNVNEDIFQETKSYSKILWLKNTIQDMSAAEILNILIADILDKINVKFVITSIRINHMNKSCNEPTLKYDIPHVDLRTIGKNMYTLIYYLNDSDGDTILYTETSKGTIYEHNIPKNLKCLARILPKKNRVVIFNASQLHSAPSYCFEDRYVINLNITTEFPIL